MRITEAYIFFLVELFFLSEKHDILSLMIFVSVIMLAMSDPQRCGDIILPNYKNVSVAELRNPVYFL